MASRSGAARPAGRQVHLLAVLDQHSGTAPGPGRRRGRAGTGPSRSCITSATPPTPKTPAACAPATHPTTPRSACSAWPASPLSPSPTSQQPKPTPTTTATRNNVKQARSLACLNSAGLARGSWESIYANQTWLVHGAPRASDRGHIQDQDIRSATCGAARPEKRLLVQLSQFGVSVIRHFTPRGVARLVNLHTHAPCFTW